MFLKYCVLQDNKRRVWGADFPLSVLVSVRISSSERVKRCPSSGDRCTKISSKPSKITRVFSLRIVSNRSSTSTGDTVETLRRRASTVRRPKSVSVLGDKLRKSKYMGRGSCLSDFLSSRSLRASRIDVVVLPMPKSPKRAQKVKPSPSALHAQVTRLSTTLSIFFTNASLYPTSFELASVCNCSACATIVLILLLNFSNFP